LHFYQKMQTFVSEFEAIHAKDAQGVFLRPRREDVQVGEDEETLVPVHFFT